MHFMKAAPLAQNKSRTTSIFITVLSTNNYNSLKRGIKNESISQQLLATENIIIKDR